VDVEGPIYAFELWLETIPEPKRKGAKTRQALVLSPFMPVRRDFAFVAAEATPAADIVRAVQSADRVLVAEARVFDVYDGPGVADGAKSVGVEVTIQPRERTLTDADIEAVSGKIVAAAEKAVAATLRA
jgi:phenylalanyl-tRNA synthetase beta chain